MKPIQFVLIAVALVAALGAGFLMMRMNNKPAPVVVQSDNFEFRPFLKFINDQAYNNLGYFGVFLPLMLYAVLTMFKYLLKFV